MFDKAIFVVGSGRCGTSWVQNWLLQHPDTFGKFGESHFIERIAPSLYVQDKIMYPYRDWFRTRGVITNSRHHIVSWLEEGEFANIMGEAIYKVYDSTTYRDKNTSALVEKTPRNIWWSESINTLLGDRCQVYFIHVYRDGRNVLESFLRQPWITYINNVTDEWIAIMEHMLNGDFPHNMLHIKYEDLVENPSISRQITEFVKLDHHGDIKTFVEPYGPNSIMSFDPHRWQDIKTPYITKDFKKMEPIIKKLYPKRV